MLARIHADHSHLGTLLSVLDAKCQRMTLGQSVNLTVIRDILDYMQRYAEHSHHPLEDIIYQYYQTKTGDGKDEIDKLSLEHQKLAAATVELTATLDLILNDIVVPKQKLIDELQGFVIMQRHHILMEEKDILPRIERTLTPDDWLEIDKQVGDKLIKDPLFDSAEDHEYEDLRVYLTEADQS